METTLLSGPSQFTLEAWNYLWRHKWFLVAIAFIPCLLETTGEYWFGKNDFNEDFFLSPINKILQPFWAMTWLSYLLKPSIEPSLKSYFKININYMWYILYALTLTVPFIGIDYVLKSYNVHLGIIFLVYFMWNLVTLTFFLLFPALSLNKHIFIKDIWKVSHPFRRDLIKSALIGLFLSMFVLAILFLLLSAGMSVIQFQPSLFLRTAAANIFGIWSDAFLLAITGIYYKRYLME